MASHCIKSYYYWVTSLILKKTDGKSFAMAIMCLKVVMLPLQNNLLWIPWLSVSIGKQNVDTTVSNTLLQHYLLPIMHFSAPLKHKEEMK